MGDDCPRGIPVDQTLVCLPGWLSCSCAGQRRCWCSRPVFSWLRLGHLPGLCLLGDGAEVVWVWHQMNSVSPSVVRDRKHRRMWCQLVRLLLPGVGGAQWCRFESLWFTAPQPAGLVRRTRCGSHWTLTVVGAP